MKTKAFTLIEVMVVMAVISILAGMMMPAVWKFWESEEIATTKQRLEDLKTAMVGDRTLVQNGVRTNFGFVGDNGELPFGNISAVGGLKYLGKKPDSGYPQWAGPYMKGGFDSGTYTTDAWGRPFVYLLGHLPVSAPYRYVYAEIRSYGPNGIANDSDDIIVNIEERETTPTAKLKGKISINSNSAKKFSADAEITYRDPNTINGIKIKEKLSCKLYPQVVGTGFFMTYSSNHFQNMPVGKIEYTANIYGETDPTCSGSPINKLDSYYFVHDDMKEILLNFPQFNNP